VSQHNPDLTLAAQRLVSSAASHGIDFSMTYATLEGPFGSSTARQACLGVLGAGRTAMLYLSEPLRGGDPGGPDIARTERARCVHAVCAMLGREHAGRVVLAQSLPDPAEQWSVGALTDAGFESVGTLLYMRRQPRAGDRKKSPVAPPLPAGLTLTRVCDIPEDRRNYLLMAAMDASYEDTMDCPRLCGLRVTRDILTSHQTTGAYDPTLWWLVMQGPTPLACLFLSLCPEQRTTELVYLGLAKPLRGKGLARGLMQFGIAHVTAMQPSWPVACAVDEANAPAVKLYDALGFRAFARRIGLVKRVT
jgi:ribosomal protein S18 acetylase RimI-like enzyme